MGPCPRPPLPHNSSRVQRLLVFSGLAGSGHMGAGIARVQSPPLGRIARPNERGESQARWVVFFMWFWAAAGHFFRSCRRAAAQIYELFEECTPIGALLRVFGVSRFQLRLSREDRCAGRAELGWFEKVTLPRVLTRTSRWLPRGDASRDVREAGRNN